METNSWHFNIFKDFVNAKLDANKDENDYEKMFFPSKRKRVPKLWK